MITKVTGIFALLLSALLAVSLASANPTEPDVATNPSGTVVIYVYHESDSTWAKSSGAIALRRIVIFVDGSKVVSLGHGRHVRITVSPGPHTISANTKIFGMLGMSKIERQVDAQAGKSYYFHLFNWHHGSGGVATAFVEVDEATGAKGVASTESVSGQAH